VKPYQAIGWSLLQTSAITAIVSTRVYHGLRPAGTDVPCINYYEIAGGTRQNGIESQTFSVNCRASSAGVARNIARLVLDLFAGSDGKGVYGTQNGFDIARASLRVDNGLVPEVEDNIFNAPVDITLVNTVDTVS